MKREKSAGPRANPCGTPQQTRKKRLLWFCKTTQKRLPERKDRVQRAKQGGRPAEISLGKGEISGRDESFGEVNSRKNCPRARLGFVKPI